MGFAGARQDSQPPMDRTAAASAASDEVVKKYTRELPQNSSVQTILVPAYSAGNGPSVPQTQQQQQQQSPSTIATVTQQQHPPATADDRFILPSSFEHTSGEQGE